MFTDVEASQTSVTVTTGPTMYEDPLKLPVRIGKGAAAWNAVLRVLGDLEWPCRLYIFLPKHSGDEDTDKGLHPLVVTAWRCILRAIDHLLTCSLRPLTPVLAAAGAGRTALRSSLPAWRRACILPLAIAAGAAVGTTTGLGMLLWNLLAAVGLLIGAVGSLAGAAAAAVAAVVALAAFGVAAAIAGGVTLAVAHAARAGAAGAVVRPDQQPLPQQAGKDAVRTEACAAADWQRRLARVFSVPWARPLPVFRMCERGASRTSSYRIHNSLADAGNHAATAGMRLASPVVLAFGLVKVVWDTWPLLLKPVGIILGAATGFLLGIGIGGCGIVWNLLGAVFDLVETAWHTAQQGIAALLICDPAEEMAAAAAVAAADGRVGHAGSVAADADADVPTGPKGSGTAVMLAADADGKEELEFAELP